MPKLANGAVVLSNSIENGLLEERSRSTDEAEWPVFSYSQMNVWNGCEQNYHYSYRQGWKPKRDSGSFALSVGTLVHSAAEIYYTNGCSEEAVDTWFFALTEESTQDQLPEIARAINIFKLYIKRFAPEADLGHEILAAEVWVLANFVTPQGRNYKIQCYIDVLSKFRNRIHVWDHKTTGQGFWHPTEVLMDPQLPIYAGCLEQQGWNVSATILNVMNTYPYKDIHTVMPDKLFNRVTIPRGKLEVQATLREFGMGVDQLIERCDTPRRNLRKSCAKCNFHDICMTTLKGFNPAPLLNRDFEKKEE